MKKVIAINVDVTKLAKLSDLNGSLGERVYAAIKGAILSLDFSPGAVIRKKEICEWFEISRSPVSDALTKLASEDLVDIVPQSGTRVSRLSMTDIREFAFLREALEVAAVRHAAISRSEEVLARLMRNIEMQKLLVLDADKDDFFKSDAQFHREIMLTTNNVRLPTTVKALSSHLDRARILLVPEPQRLAETVEEHIAIVEAIKHKNMDMAQKAMAEHLQQLIRRLEPLEKDRPDLFSS